MPEKKEGRKVGEGAAVKFIKTEIIEPWEMFAETIPNSNNGIAKDEAAEIVKSYHEFLVKHSHDPERMRCIVCGRYFRPRKKGDDRQLDLAGAEK